MVGTTLGHRHRPHLLEAWGQRFNLQIDDPHLALFRYSDVPGMVGRVGCGPRRARHQHLGRRRRPPGRDGARSDLAVMAVTTDVRVPDAVVGEIAGSDGSVSRLVAVALRSAAKWSWPRVDQSVRARQRGRGCPVPDPAGVQPAGSAPDRPRFVIMRKSGRLGTYWNLMPLILQPFVGRSDRLGRGDGHERALHAADRDPVRPHVQAPDDGRARLGR